MLYIPSATYRLQLSAKFTLKNVREILPYLHELGISTIYAAPLFKARTGSEHGYDVAEAHLVGPEIGNQEELDELARELKQKNMGWLQDIVPNHMVFHPENTWLMDVLEKGQKSRFFSFFDIDLQHPEFAGKLMVPFLGEPLDKVLEQKQLTLGFTEQGFQLRYFDTAYPASISIYGELLQQVLDMLGESEVADQLMERKEHLLRVLATDVVDLPLWQQVKFDLYQTIEQNPKVKQALETVLDKLNNDPDQLHELLDLQFYRFCFWQDTEQRINYRRFFTVNELICLSMEKPEVFSYYHSFIQQLCDRGVFQGLRVDHIDGLFDPDTYLERLREMTGPDTYLVVEKILEGEENLPENWPIQGNSGYDFLAWVSNLYTDAAGEAKLTRLYQNLVPGAATDYERLVYEKKLFILKNQMNGELDNLLRLLQQSELLPNTAGEDQWREALAALLSSFPVYRIYARQFPLPEQAEQILDQAFAHAKKYAPEYQLQLAHLRTLFQLQKNESAEVEKRKLYFVMRSQQFTGPLAAKGVEDTTFYNYNRLLSLNEVGNSPEVFHLKRRDFHELMQYKLQTYPHSLNATATHDTKRGEGVRMRLQVLTEVPDEWAKAVQQWLDLIRQKPDGKTLTANDLYFMLQTLVGVLPIDGSIDDTLVERVQEYLIKAFREAKVNTNWTTPNEDYENAAKKLVEDLLTDEEKFLPSFLPFFRKLAHYGWLYSLCQTTLKLTCPGVPDIYQGCELWDFSLVDPDNRRPVDYELRRQLLKEVKQSYQQDVSQLHAALLCTPSDARIKLYLVWKVLNERKNYKELFDFGSYQQLVFTGRHHHSLVAFARVYKGKWCLVAVPRLLAQVTNHLELPLGESVWADTAITLPPTAPKKWRNAFGDEQLQANGSLKLADIFSSFPVAVLFGED